MEKRPVNAHQIDKRGCSFPRVRRLTFSVISRNTPTHNVMRPGAVCRMQQDYYGSG
jgi:hypothetical protein